MDTLKLQPEVIDFLLESNAIEGVYDDDSLQQAIYAWDYLVQQKELTPGVICKTHKILMLHQRLLPNEKGYFRDVDVYIGGRMGLAPASIRYAIDELCKVIKDQVQTSKVVPINTPGQKEARELVCQAHHVRYEQIHPFVDGNGRTGRMFMNWQRLQMGLEILVIKEDDKYEYYKWF